MRGKSTNPTSVLKPLELKSPPPFNVEKVTPIVAMKKSLEVVITEIVVEKEAVEEQSPYVALKEVEDEIKEIDTNASSQEFNEMQL